MFPAKTQAMGDKVNLRGVLFFHCTQEICTARWYLKLTRFAMTSGIVNFLETFI